MLAVLETPSLQAATTYLARFFIIIANRNRKDGESAKVFSGFIKEAVLVGR